jgi:hypothetical protein
MISRESIVLVSFLLIAGYFLSLNPSTVSVKELTSERSKIQTTVSTINTEENMQQNPVPETTIQIIGEAIEEAEIITETQTSISQPASSTPTTTEPTTASTTSTVIEEKLIFTEVYYDTAGNDNDEEYVIIHNMGSEINLDSWSINDNSGSWSFPDIIINSQEYLVVARDAAGFAALFGCQPDIDGFTRGLNNDGDQLSLQKDGQQRDFVAWEKGFESAYSDWSISAGKGKALKRNSESISPSSWSESDPNPC